MIFSALFEKRASFSRADPRDPVVAKWFGGRGTVSGVDVTPETAMTLTAVFGCIRILSETIAALPINLLRRRSGRVEHATQLPLYNKVKHQPNRWQTSFEWREMMIGHAALRGNAYSEIISVPAGPVNELIPLHPDRVRPFRAPDGTIAYEYSPPDGDRRVILAHEMHHLRGLSSDGIVGLDVFDLLRETFGLTMATEQHGAAFFGNGANPGGVLEHPGKLGEEASSRLVKSWNARHQGAASASKLAVLEEGMQYRAIGVEPEKAQFLETRKFQVTDIARAFRIPPHMLADLDRATFSNIEHQSLEFVMHTLTPWLVRWEQALSRDLLTRERRRDHFFKFSVDGLLRGDIKSRYEAYRTGREWGWLSVNDVRTKEDMNPVEGGDQYLVPLNMTTPDNLGREPMQQASAERIARKEHRAVSRAVKRPETFPAWLDGFCTDHARWASEVLGVDASSVVDALRSSWQDMPADEVEYVEQRAAEIMRLINGY